jgi:hypothetical protein
MPFDSTSPEYYPQSNFKLGGTDGVLIPSGTTNQRPTDDFLGNGMIRYNISTASLEAYVAGAWATIRVPGTSTIVKDTATGNNVLTAFNMLSASVADENNVLIFINNVFQEADVAYTISGTTVTFTSAPPNTHKIVALSGFDTV